MGGKKCEKKQCNATKTNLEATLSILLQAILEVSAAFQTADTEKAAGKKNAENVVENVEKIRSGYGVGVGERVGVDFQSS